MRGYTFTDVEYELIFCSRDHKDPVEIRESLVRPARGDRRATVDSLDCRGFLDLL